MAETKTPERKPEFERRYMAVTARRVEFEEEVETPDGPMKANPGDWILTELQVAGAQYVSPDAVFRKNFLPMNEEAKELFSKETE